MSISYITFIFKILDLLIILCNTIGEVPEVLLYTASRTMNLVAFIWQDSAIFYY